MRPPDPPTSAGRGATAPALRTAPRLAVAACALALAACGDPPAPAQAPRRGTAETAPAKPDWRLVDRDVTTPLAIEWIGPRGTGDTYAVGDVALVHWIGRRPDGSVYMGSVPDDLSGTRKPLDPLPAERDLRNAAPQPFGFEVGRGHVIPGMDRMVLAMRVGDHAKAKIRPALAYGALGFGTKVPANAEISLEIWAVGRVPPLAPEWLKRGEGATPGALDQVWMHLVVSHPDTGQVLQTTRRPRPDLPDGLPLVFLRGTGTVIEGVERIIPTMRVGDRVKVRMPWFFAYGPEPRLYGDVPMPAMSDLDYDLEMVAFGPADTGNK